MTQFIRDKAGADEASQKKALAYLFAQDSTGLATDGVLTGLAVSQQTTASASVNVAAGAGVVQDSAGSGASMVVNDTQLALDVKAILPQGRASLAAATAGYQAGKTDLLTLLDSQSTLFAYETSYYRSLADFADAIAQLEAVVGKEVLR